MRATFYGEKQEIPPISSSIIPSLLYSIEEIFSFPICDLAEKMVHYVHEWDVRILCLKFGVVIIVLLVSFVDFAYHVNRRWNVNGLVIPYKAQKDINFINF